MRQYARSYFFFSSCAVMGNGCKRTDESYYIDFTSNATHGTYNRARILYIYIYISCFRSNEEGND